MNTQARISAPQHYDRDIEAAVVGHVLARAGALADISHHCTPDDFTSEIYARVIEAALSLKEEGFAVSPVTIKPRMSADIARAVEAETGLQLIDFLSGLSNRATPFQKVGELARSLADLSLRRRLDADLEAAKQRLCAYDRQPMACLQGVMETIGVASEKEARTAGYMGLPEAIDDMMQEAEAAENGVAPESVKTGLKDVDAVTGGFQGGDMVVIAGRPGQGKTVLLGAIARAAAEVDRPAIVFELEMRRRSIIHRLVADMDYDVRGSSPPLAYARMRSGKLWRGEFDRMFAASQRLRMLPIEIFDTPGMTIHQIGQHAQRFADRAKTMGIIVIDYLQIISAGERYFGAKVQEMTEVSNEIKRMAKRIGWPVAVGCQLNRDVEKREKDRRPQLSDLRETGAIEQDADIVIGMHRPAYYIARKRPEKGRDAGQDWIDWLAEMEICKHDLELSIPKNRSGPDGLVKCFVDIGASAIRNTPSAEPETASGEGLLV